MGTHVPGGRGGGAWLWPRGKRQPTATNESPRVHRFPAAGERTPHRIGPRLLLPVAVRHACCASSVTHHRARWRGASATPATLCVPARREQPQLQTALAEPPLCATVGSCRSPIRSRLCTRAPELEAMLALLSVLALAAVSAVSANDCRTDAPKVRAAATPRSCAPASACQPKTSPGPSLGRAARRRRRLPGPRAP